MREYKGLSTLPLISIEKDLVEKEIGKTLTDKQWAIVREEILLLIWQDSNVHNFRSVKV